MTANARLMFILSAFFLLADIVYVIWTLAYDSQNLATDPSGGTGPYGRIEWVGTVALGLTAVFSALIGFYLSRVAAGQGGVLPQDSNDAEIDDGDAEQGFFSPHSWWPVLLALSLTIMFVGLAVGVWLVFFGVPFLLISLVGWNYQYYRGYFAR